MISHDEMLGIVCTEAVEAICQHPWEQLLWYDGSLHCFRCRTTWHKDFPAHAGPSKVWGRPDQPAEPDYSI